MTDTTQMRALVVKEGNVVQVELVPRASISSPKEILLKIISVGQNPTDWKSAKYTTTFGLISGCDCVGEVVELGKDVPADKVHMGEIRWAFVPGCKYPDKGAFAEYVNVEWDITGVVPENITPQQAASIPIPFATAVQAFYLRLGLPQPPEKDETGKWILIWSGATAVGQYAIQLAKLSGFKVATTASEKRWPLLKSLGADVILDYKDPKAVDKLKEATNDSIGYGLDCISENGSVQLAQQAFQPNGGHLVTLLAFDPKDLPRENVRTEQTLAYTALGADVQWRNGTVFKSSREDRALYVKWCAKSTELLKSGALKPMEVDVLGGLEDIKKGFELMASGKHNTKLVYNI